MKRIIIGVLKQLYGKGEETLNRQVLKENFIWSGYEPSGFRLHPTTLGGALSRKETVFAKWESQLRAGRIHRCN